MSVCLPGLAWYGGLFKTDALKSLPFEMASDYPNPPDPDSVGTLCDRSKISIRKVRPDGPCFDEDDENKAVHGELHGAPPHLTVHPLSVGMTFEGWQESQPSRAVGYNERVNGGCIRVLTYKCCKWDVASKIMTLPDPTIWAWRSGGPEDISVYRPHTSCSWTVRHQREQVRGTRGWQHTNATYTPVKPTGADIVTILNAVFPDPKRWHNCVAPSFDLCLIAYIYAIYYQANRGNNPECQQTRIGDGRVWLQGCIDSLWGQACS